MQEITAYDMNGNILTELVQWDKNISVSVHDEAIDKAYKVHFCNRHSAEAMVVQSTYRNNTLTFEVPNDILIEPYPIIGYIWLEKNKEQKSVFCFKFMVRKRPKPANYVYSDEKNYITFEQVLKEAKDYAASAKDSADNAKNSETNAINSENNAKQSETNAKNSEINAESYKEKAEQSENNALSAAIMAANQAFESEINANLSKSYAVGTQNIVRENDSTDNSKYYSERSKDSSEISKAYLTQVEQAGNTAIDQIKDALDMNAPNFQIDLSTGHLMYTGGRFTFQVNTNGHLEWGLAI